MNMFYTQFDDNADMFEVEPFCFLPINTVIINAII